MLGVESKFKELDNKNLLNNFVLLKAKKWIKKK